MATALEVALTAEEVVEVGSIELSDVGAVLDVVFVLTFVVIATDELPVAVALWVFVMVRLCSVLGLLETEAGVADWLFDDPRVGKAEAELSCRRCLLSSIKSPVPSTSETASHDETTTLVNRMLD